MIAKWIRSRAKKTEKPGFNVTYDHLAVPEVHTGTVRHEEPPASQRARRCGFSVDYENLTIPEVHPGKRKNKQAD